MDFLRRLFGIEPRKSVLEQAREREEATRYSDISSLNLAAVIANRLANLICADSRIALEGDSFLQESLERCVKWLRVAVTRTLGIGGVVLKPYILHGRIYTDIVPISDYFVIEKQGEVVTKAGFIADSVSIGAVNYIRVEIHELSEDGDYYITNKSVRGERECSLSEVEAWSGIEPVVTITGVDKMLFAHLRSPVDERAENPQGYGVSVIYGQEWLGKMISDLLNEVPGEYLNKKAFIGADDLLFDSGEKLPANGLYKLLRSAGGSETSFWEVFSPEIRHTSYFEGIDYLLGLMEKAIGLNRGVLTDLSTGDATATAIKRSTFDTFSFVDEMRKNVENAVRELIYAYGVIGEAFELCEGVDTTSCKVVFDWSYGLIEDSAETFSQLMEAKREGIITDDEVRKFLMNEKE